MLAKADPERGRFRCFLQGVLRNWLRRERRLAARLKTEPLGWEPGSSEPDELERREQAEWAQALLQAAIERLRAENERQADVLVRSYGIEPWPRASSEALGAEYGLKPNALYQLRFRATRRLRELVLEEIAATVSSPADFASESELVIARLLEAPWGEVFATD